MITENLGKSAFTGKCVRTKTVTSLRDINLANLAKDTASMNFRLIASGMCDPVCANKHHRYRYIQCIQLRSYLQYHGNGGTIKKQASRNWRR